MATYKLQQNETVSISQVGRFFRIFTAVSDLRVRISGRGKEYYNGKLAAGVGVEFTDLTQFPEPFDTISITTETAQTVDLWHELAKADDDRLSGNFDINAALTVASTAPRNHGSGSQSISVSTEVLPFRQTRKTALIQVDGEVYVDTVGGVVMSGLFAWENQSALNLIPLSGAVLVRINEDFD